MALRWKAYAPNTILKAVEVQDLADNGVIQLDTAADLASADLVNANVVYVVAEAKPYVRQAAGVGADKWQVFSGGLSGLGGWANITATTGSPTKHEYTDADGNDWTAYEWTGDGTVTTSDGLVDALVISGGSIGATHPQGGRITYGIDKLSGVIPVVVDGPGGSSAGGRLGDIKVPSIGGANQAANVIGAGGYGTTSSDKVNGVLSDITGSPVEYGTALTSGANTPVVNGNLGPAGPGSANREGTVIVRVPRSNAKA